MFAHTSFLDLLKHGPDVTDPEMILETTTCGPVTSPRLSLKLRHNRRISEVLGYRHGHQQPHIAKSHGRKMHQGEITSEGTNTLYSSMQGRRETKH